MMTDRQQNWTVRKPAARAAGGVVASQNLTAAEVGARVLRDGGNAVDAAIATAFAVSVLEPWMSGMGGGGMMLVHSAAERRVRGIAFGMVAPLDLDPTDYPLGPAEGGDLFPWPTVAGNHNVLGALAIAVPGHVAGLALAHERFASRPWADLLAPAVALAEAGLPVSWHTTLKIAASAKDLRRFEPARATYLPGGLPPVPHDDGTLPRLPLGRLPATLRRLAEAGPRDFYQGEIAHALASDVQAAGGRLSADDLARYRAVEVDAPAIGHGDAAVHVIPGLTAGPTLRHALELVAERVPRGAGPGADAYLAWAEALFAAYEHRLATMGDVADDSQSPSCTTHLSVADGAGNLVSLTQTLLSSFGSKVISPRTGVLLNNGIMWFDPRPGRPNSIAPGKRPLSNMCPVIALRADGRTPWFALGASGGRRILPAVLQITSMLAACGLDPEEAVHHPRIDVSGDETTLTADPRLPAEVVRALEARHRVLRREHAVYPSLFACPSLALRDPATGACLGLSDPMNPVSGAAG